MGTGWGETLRHVFSGGCSCSNCHPWIQQEIDCLTRLLWIRYPPCCCYLYFVCLDIARGLERVLQWHIEGEEGPGPWAPACGEALGQPFMTCRWRGLHEALRGAEPPVPSAHREGLPRAHLPAAAPQLGIGSHGVTSPPGLGEGPGHALLDAWGRGEGAEVGAAALQCPLPIMKD